jgi:hypothetical protein
MRIPVLFAEGLALPSSGASSSPLATNIPLPVISFILYSEQGFLEIQQPNKIRSHATLDKKHQAKLI